MRSESLGELAAALAKAQVAFRPIKKGRTAKIASAKGSYEYQYADLADVIDATAGALAANGLAISQPVEIDESGGSVVTHLIHSSGQYLTTSCRFALGDRMQETGARITYLRRYALSGVLGVASEDDTDLSESATAPRKASTAPAPAPATGKTIAANPGKPGAISPVASPTPQSPDSNESPAAAHQRLRVMETAKRSGWLPESVILFMDRAWGAKMVRDLTPEQVEYLIKTIGSRTHTEAMASLAPGAATSFEFGANSPERIK